ncbi:MAG: suppressor of los1-1 [Cyphobasidiales sp. Tagirdzhanova-0007]|nr:MAG: suppressor of los1-1 [Cyphobasidiales sp. Tagirdzhanova-0007]
MATQHAHSPTPPVLYAFDTADEVSQKLAEFVIAAQNDALNKRSAFKLAISGGSLAATLAKNLVGNDRVQWKKWEVFFADERIVPLDHEDSNFKLNNDTLFSKVPIMRRNIHTINPDLLDNPEELAEEYEQQLIACFAGKNAVAFPRFDLVLLGMGPDGHTCSLFPGHALLHEELRWIAWLDDSPKPPSKRITLTYPVLAHAYRAAFVTTGEGKKEILSQALDGHDPPLPASLVRPVAPGEVFWFTDEAAASQTKYERSNFHL